MGREGQRGKNQDNCNRIAIKMIKMKQTIPPKQNKTKQNKTRFHSVDLYALSIVLRTLVVFLVTKFKFYRVCLEHS